jgi:Flp pilus assembly protein TadD
MNLITSLKKFYLVKRPARVILVLAASLSLTVACETHTSGNQPVTSVPSKAVAINPTILDYVDRSIQQGRHKEATSILEQLLVSHPNHGRTRLLLAELRLATGYKRAAAQIFSELTEIPEFAARAYQGVGIAYLMAGERALAVGALQKSVEIDPKSWRAWNGLGFHHDSLGEWKEAHRSYTNALSAMPNSAILYSNRGYSQILSGDVDAALPDLFKAVGLDPKLTVAQINLRIALAWKGRYREALLGVDEGKLGTAFNNIGFVALMRGDRASAETYFREAMRREAAFNETASRNLDYLKNTETLEASPRSPQ